MSTKKKTQVNNIFFNDEKGFQQKINLFKKWRKEDSFVISDFDRTITKNFFGEEEVPSIMSILRKRNFLWDEYTQKAFSLYETYHPIELDISLSQEKKSKKMLEWWEKHFQILKEYGLNKRVLYKINEDIRLQTREYFEEFSQLLFHYNIPLLIFSASGLWGESIENFFKMKKIAYKNVSFVSNTFSWDNEGKMINYSNAIIHTFNKEMGIIRKDFPKIYKKIENKKNILLFWDTIGDSYMADNFAYENIIKFWFLNKNIEENREEYTKYYDVVITWDGDFSFVLDVVKEIFGK